MSDSFRLILIAAILIIIAFGLQYIFCHLFKPLFLKLIPTILFLPIWIVCILGTLQIIDLPTTSTIIDGGFIAFHDYDIISITGIPVLLGYLLAWMLHYILRRKYRT